MCRKTPNTFYLLLAVLLCLLISYFVQFECFEMSSQTRANSKLPRATKSTSQSTLSDRSSTEHNYVKQNAPRKGKLNKSNSQPVNYDNSSDENSDNSVSFLDEPETAPC